MAFPSKNLTDLADQLLKSSGGSDLSLAGPATTQVRDAITISETRTRPFVASVFWQALILTTWFERLLDSFAIANPRLRIKLMQVVPHGGRHPPHDRYDLLIFVEDLATPDLYTSTDARPTEQELREGSAKFLHALGEPSAQSELLSKMDHASVAVEALKVQPFQILVFPAPDMKPTASVPSPSLRVLEPDSGAVSTVGVIATNNHGQMGVTVAWHAINNNASGGISVDDMPGHVVSSDALSDSAFVAINLSHAIPAPAKPLSGLVPRAHETVFFEGVASGPKTGRVAGWSPQLPFVSRNAQLVVTTDPISAPGDSGAALRDGQGMLLGFCHETSEFGVANPYSSWIWADSVFRAHQLL